MADDKSIKVIHERNICIGCCACEAIAPKYWVMNKDNKADLVGATKVEGKDEVYELSLDAIEGNVEAAESCPVNCIHVEENGKRKI